MRLYDRFFFYYPLFFHKCKILMQIKYIGVYAQYGVCNQVFMPPPDPIGPLTVVLVTSSSIQISWAAPARAENYVVHIKKSYAEIISFFILLLIMTYLFRSESTYTQYTTTSTSYTFSSLQSSTSYQVKVVAWNSVGQSPPESETTITTASGTNKFILKYNIF